ncbi:MAG: GntR family transcriptional regulator [Actinomycetota bacterium]|nr:GntR family transcriptional regulator [Actinomycetota bacterium]
MNVQTNSSGRSDAADLVHEHVRKAIVRGELEPGERLTETHLAETLKVSRTPVREAFVRLEADGFVELVRNRGAFVSRWTEDDLEEIFSLRVMLEGYGAKVGAGKITPAEIQELENLANRMDDALERLVQSGDGDEQKTGIAEECATLNTLFHGGIVSSAGNQRLSTIVSNLTSLPLIHRTIILQSPVELAHSWGQHRDMIEALRKGDGDWAEALVRAHISAGRSIMRRAAQTV